MSYVHLFCKKTLNFIAEKQNLNYCFYIFRKILFHKTLSKRQIL